LDIFKKKIDYNDLIWGIDAARILGISKRTFDNRWHKGYYNEVYAIRTPKGFKYSMRDVMKIAHPKANDQTIETMIHDFNMQKTMKSRRSKKKRE